MKALLSMYSLREMMAKDLDGALSHAKRLGYDGIELAWYAGHPVADVRAAVRRQGLQVMSCHTDVREMCAGPEKNFEDIASLGAKYVIICHMTPEERPGGARYAETIETVARLEELARTQYGLNMLYHNHDFDQALLPDGRRSLEATYDTFPVKGQLDTCWVELCGLSTVDYLKKYSGRIPLMHIKDFRPCAASNVPAPGLEFCPLGWGVTDFAAIVAAAEAAGVEGLILELDEPGCGLTALQCVEEGTPYFMKLMGR